MTFIALGNFLCDGVSVSKGEILSVEKVEALSTRLDLLQGAGLLEMSGPVPSEPVEEPVIEPVAFAEPIVEPEMPKVEEKKRKKKGS